MQLVSTIALLFLVACGGEDRSPSPPAKNIIEQNWGNPVILTLHQPACEQSRLTESLGEQTVYRWNGRQVEPVAFDFDEFSGFNLGGGSVSSAQFNFYEVIDVICSPQEADDTSGESCPQPTFEQRTIQLPSTLSICSDDAAFPRDTIEAAALTTTSHLHQAHLFYKGLTPAREINKVRIETLPRYELKIHRETPTDHVIYTTTLTDNASWAVDSYGNSSITIFPHSREWIAAMGEPRLHFWEHPWIIAHEYGHQIFFTHFPEFLWDVSSTDLGGHRLPIRRGLVPSTLERERSVDAELILTALNEAFADLFAHYALEQEGGLKLGPCFGKSRHVASSIFGDRTPKALTDEVHGIFVGDTIWRSQPDCEKPNFQDPHHMGAIIAHGIGRTLQESTLVNPQEKAAFAIMWIDRLARLRQDIGAREIDPILFFDASLTEYFHLLTEDSKDLTSEQCAAILEVFPRYHDRWLPDGCPSSNETPESTF